MADPIYADFDQFEADSAGEGPTIRLAGSDWQLPPDAPARFVARIARIEASLVRAQASGAMDDPDADVPPEILDGMTELNAEDILRGLVGDDLVEQWLDAGVGHRVLERLSRTALGYYRTGTWADPFDQPKRKAKAPADRKPKTTKKRTTSRSGSSTSSSTGRRSKRTSSASTGSGS